MSELKNDITVTVHVEMEPSETFKAIADLFGYEKVKPSRSELDAFKRGIDEIGDDDE